MAICWECRVEVSWDRLAVVDKIVHFAVVELLGDDESNVIDSCTSSNVLTITTTVHITVTGQHTLREGTIETYTL